MTKELAEFAHDLHSGLSSQGVAEFDDLVTIGMAASLAIHIRGFGEIDYEVLRKVSDHFISIPSYALEKVLGVLEEIEFVQLIKNGKRIAKVIPSVPIFDDVYEKIGDYANSECTINSHEQATLLILKSLRDAPANKDTLINTLGVEKPIFDRCVALGAQSGIVSEHQARGRSMLISPFYFSDNLDGLADAAVAVGSHKIKSTLEKVKTNQGWPITLIKSRGEIGGVKLDATELSLIEKLSVEGIIRPPTIKFGSETESFLFTPKPGSVRLNAANREIYERAMALISAVRKGQLLPDTYRIRMPVRLLESFRDKGYLGANSEASDQYRNLVYIRVAFLESVGPTRWRLRLNRTPENVEALNLAINLLRTGDLAGMDLNQEARIALSKDEQYIQSLISASEMKKRSKEITDPQAMHEFEQLILKL